MSRGEDSSPLDAQRRTGKHADRPNPAGPDCLRRARPDTSVFSKIQVQVRFKGLGATPFGTLRCETGGSREHDGNLKTAAATVRTDWFNYILQAEFKMRRNTFSIIQNIYELIDISRPRRHLVHVLTDEQKNIRDEYCHKMSSGTNDRKLWEHYSVVIIYIATH